MVLTQVCYFLHPLLPARQATLGLFEVSEFVEMSGGFIYSHLEDANGSRDSGTAVHRCSFCLGAMM